MNEIRNAVDHIGRQSVAENGKDSQLDSKTEAPLMREAESGPC